MKEEKKVDDDKEVNDEESVGGSDGDVGLGVCLGTDFRV